MTVSAVQARIAAIEARFAPRHAQPHAGAGFGTVLASALERVPATPGSQPAAAALAPPGGAALAPPGGAALAPPAQPAVPPPAADRVAGSGPVAPPPELMVYGNGRIPPEALSPLGIGEHRLWAPAAAAFQRLHADAAAAGIRIGVTDSYRSYEQQVDLARRKGLYSEGGLAATPGRSNHGWGLSVDLNLDARAQEWMRANAGRYGFVEDVPREPWHWTYHGAG